VSAVVVAGSFEERVFQKIREDFASLMTDAEIKALVDKTIERTFFQPRIVPDGYRSKELPPLLVELVQKQTEPLMLKAISAWLEANPDKVTAALDAALAGGLVAALGRALDTKMSHPLYELQMKLQGVLGRPL
jgi:hypothetical protein